MKKTVVSVLALVLVVSLSLVAFVACNPDDGEKGTKASNSEVLGTTVAVLASNVAGASTSSVDNAEANFEAGVNIKVGEDNQLSVAAAGLITTNMGEALESVFNNMVNRVDKVLGENGVKIEKATADAGDEYTEKYSITITYIDEESGETATQNLALYIKLSDGAEIESQKDYTFEAKVVWVSADGEETEVAKFNGKATYDTAKEAMVFALGTAGDLDKAGAFANVKAYATAQGTVKIDLGAGAGIAGALGANASLSVEVGKLANNQYGAVVTAQGEAGVEGLPVVGDVKTTFVATINVYANSADNAGEFIIDGKVEATATAAGLTYKGTANLSGKAVYDAANEKANVGLEGVINFERVTENK